MSPITIHKDPLKQGDYCHELYYCSAARVGFRHLLKHLEFGKNEKILLPSYIGESVNEGSGVWDPVAECQIEYEFYAVDKGLAADLPDLQAKLSKPGVKALLVIHYFGILQSDIEEIVRLCRAHNVLLIEDCAHTLTSRFQDKALGEFGDFSLYSIHKILPVHDGGILRVNRRLNLPPLDESDKMSWDTLAILCKSRLDEIAKIRRDNYILLARELEGTSGIEIMYPDIGAGIAPHDFPLLLTQHDRKQIFAGLVAEGIRPIALYYKLVAQIPEQEYPISYNISKKILNLPIHQDINADDILFMAKTLRGLLQQ